MIYYIKGIEIIRNQSLFQIQYVYADNKRNYSLVESVMLRHTLEL